MDDIENESKGYAWEGSLERSWEAIEEDETGNLKVTISSTKKRHQRHLQIARNVRKGLIRYVYIILDLSRGMGGKDWKPHRLACISDLLQQFVKDYFDQNPISQLGLIAIKGLKAEKLSELSGNPKNHIEKLKHAVIVEKEPSLQNALDVARGSLKIVPTYGSREIIVVYGSLVTADPGDIFASITALKRESIRVSVVGIGAEMHLLRQIANATQGTYNVAIDAVHAKHLMKSFTFPCPTMSTKAARFSSLVEMGFPQRKQGAVLSLCVCHQKFTTVGYYCPRCKSKCCDLPTVCQICNLPLVSSPHLARSYHHLFPIVKFDQTDIVSQLNLVLNEKCFGCLLPLAIDSEGSFYTCSGCKNMFCSECDVYIHDLLHNCPGCC